MNYPTSKDDGTSLPNPTGTNTQNNPDHAGLHTSENAAIIAVETKLGTGSSVPASNTLLIGTGAGTSAWSSITSAQLAAILSDETGTGAAVFANTPVLITPKVDTINENTGGNGVTVGGVNLKSGVITTPSSVTDTAVAAGALKATKFSNPYKFNIYRTAAYTFVASTFTRTPFDTKGFDTGSNTDVTTTQGRFTAPVTGYYWLGGAVRTSQGSGGHRVLTALYKNGVEVARGTDGSGSGGALFFNGSVVSTILSLTANDTVDLFYFTDAAMAMDVTAPVSTNYFSGFLVSTT